MTEVRQMNYSDLAEKIRRERETEAEIRSMETHEIVSLVHDLEDREAALEARAEAAESRIAELEALALELAKCCDAACGYLLNAKIDLETGAPKRTAICTIEGGLKTVRAALASPLLAELRKKEATK